MTLSNSINKISHEDLFQIRNFISESAGIFFEDKKFYFLEKRILKRINATNSVSPKEYYRLLKLEKKHDEMQELLNLITTNETYFYRNLPQLESFLEEVVPLVLEEKKKKNDPTVKLWCAASSSGEEPYTLAILLKEGIRDFSRWRVEVVASDIDEVVLERARQGVYNKRSVKDVPPKVLSKYFDEEDGKYLVKQEIKDMVRFERLNLMDRRGMRKFNGQDFVFCRNVLIYFSDESRRQVVNCIYDVLNPGGFIFLGHSESVGKISAAFKLMKFKKSLSYRK